MKYRQTPNIAGATRFSKSPMAEVEYSKMTSVAHNVLTMNAGDIVPVWYEEVLPHSTFQIDSEFILRQTTLLRPTMDKMFIDLYAFFVPNRIVNQSWKNVQGENTSGFWAAPQVELAPLVNALYTEDVQVPVGSVADYYGFPTQGKIKNEYLKMCNDLKFRGYLEIYNRYFRSENYQNPIPYSKLNVYNGFFEPKGNYISFGDTPVTNLDGTEATDGSYATGAVAKALNGDGSPAFSSAQVTNIGPRISNWSALESPLKANKLHDPFTSLLPHPQKGPDVIFGIGDAAPIIGADSMHDISGSPLTFGVTDDMGASYVSGQRPLVLGDAINQLVNGTQRVAHTLSAGTYDAATLTDKDPIAFTNAVADLSQATGITVNDLRTAIATQQVYETLARGGSRYESMLASFFEIDTENPFPDIPVKLGHVRRELDLFQVAQTSATDESSPQGTLAGYGYTNNGGQLFTYTAREHGYVHIMAVVRQPNTYSSYLAPDNFRLSTLDFYLPQFANIGEQPVLRRTLNPFAGTSEDVIGYQEPWWEYRYSPNRTAGYMRSGIAESLDIWTYSDDFDITFSHVNGEWLKSNAQEVMDRTLAVTSSVAPQIKALFEFKITKELPMPTYSIPGLDTI